MDYRYHRVHRSTSMQPAVTPDHGSVIYAILCGEIITDAEKRDDRRDRRK